MDMAPPPAADGSVRRPLRRYFARRLDVTLALVVSAALLVAGLVLPVLYVEKLWFFTQTVSIAGGIWTLVQHGSFGLAAVMTLFSVLFPITKLVALGWVWHGSLSASERERWLHRLALLGKWSMLDVYVVATLVVAVKLGALAQAEPRAGVYVFAGSILLSMAATSRIARLARMVAPVATPEAGGRPA